MTRVSDFLGSGSAEKRRAATPVPDRLRVR
jgi:hypothetical protein